MKKVIYLILLVTLPGLKSQAQSTVVYKDQVRIENQSVTRSEDNRLTISMDIIMQANMKITSNRFATLTPILEADGRTKSLPPVVLRSPPGADARTQQHHSQRRIRDSTPETSYGPESKLPDTVALRSLDAKSQSGDGNRPLRLPRHCGSKPTRPYHFTQYRARQAATCHR